MTSSWILLRRGLRPAYRASFVGALPAGWAFARASAKWGFDAAGILTQVGVDTPCFDYGVLGTQFGGELLVEPAATNGIRNSTMGGAAAGAPGTLPSNWAAVGLSGLTREIMAVGTEYGMPYVDVRISGTPGATGNYQILFESAAQIVAANGEVWTVSLFTRLVGGSLSNLTMRVGVNENTSAGAFVTSGSNIFVPSAALARGVCTRTLNGGGTVARVQPLINFAVTSGLAVDVTLRVFQPQCEKLEFDSSPIVTSGAAATRAMDVCTLPLGAWFNPLEGTFDVRATAPNGVQATAGTYAVLQADDGGTGNRHVVGRNNTRDGRCFTFSSGVLQAAISASGTWGDGALAHLAFAYRQNDSAVAMNGSAVLTGAGGVPAGLTTLRLTANGSGASSLPCRVRDLAYYNRRLSDAQVQRVAA